MSLSGDLKTLDLANLLQNLETHRQSGVLTVESGEDTAHMYFSEGCLTLFSREERVGLMGLLLASGTITEEQHAEARKKRRRSRKSLGEVLIQTGSLEEGVLEQVANARLVDEACELVTAKRGSFSFQAGGIPRGMFDPEERRLKMVLHPGPLLMEAARRDDHWQLIRQRVPSVSAHFVAQGRPRGLEPAAEALAAQVLPLLDGSNSVAEVVDAFAHRRFEVHQLLSDLVEARTIRAVGPDEWLELISAARRSDLERAERLLERALSANPHHIDLLTEEVALAEDVDQLERAVDALKMVIHLAAESGDNERARRELERARELAPDEPSFLERAVKLALEDGDRTAAVRDGLTLVELWRKPGLHAKAATLLTELLAAQPDDPDLLFELSRSRADCGDLAGAVEPLFDRGEALLSSGDEQGARRSFEDVCRLDPSHEQAREQLGFIERGDATRARARRALRWKRFKSAVVFVLLASLCANELLAQYALIEAGSRVSRERLIEAERYDEAARSYAQVLERFPASLTARWSVQRRLQDLALKGGTPDQRSDS